MISRSLAHEAPQISLGAHLHATEFDRFRPFFIHDSYIFIKTTSASSTLGTRATGDDAATARARQPLPCALPYLFSHEMISSLFF